MTLVRRPDLAVTVTTVPPPHRAVGALDRWIAGSIPDAAPGTAYY